MQYTICIIYNIYSKMSQFITLIRMMCIKISNNNVTGVAKQWRNWNPRVLLAGANNGAAAVETSMAGPEKIRNRIPM